MKALLVALAPAFLIPSLPQDDALDQEGLEKVTAEIQKQVEALREREFPREVKVSVANEEELRRYVIERMEETTPPAKQAAQETAAKLLGLIPVEMNYVETLLALLEEQVGGFYDPDSEAFFLMSKFSDDLARVILAHELTHALDDQLYDIDGTLEQRSENTDASYAYYAVVEGSGTAVMNVWTMQRLTAGELDLNALQEVSEMGMEAMAEAPPYLWKPLLGSYLRGAAFLNRTESLLTGSAKYPDLEDFHQAFSTPPRSSEQILHPAKYWDPDERDEPVDVAFEVGSLPEGWSVLDEDTLGEMGWGLVLEPPKKRKGLAGQMALLGTRFTYPGAEGWGGDRYLLLGREDARILFAQTVWDDADEAREFKEALSELRPHLEAAVDGFWRSFGGEGDERRGLEIVAEEQARAVSLCVWSGVVPDERQSILERLKPRIGGAVETR